MRDTMRVEKVTLNDKELQKLFGRRKRKLPSCPANGLHILKTM